MSLSIKCSNPTCRAKIPDGEQVVVWDILGGELLVRFVCLRCGDDQGYMDITEEVTGVLMQ
jgi:hypothetical protein